MAGQFIFYFAAIVVAIATLSWLVAYGWRHRSSPGAVSLAWFAMLGLWAALAEGLSVISPTPDLAAVWRSAREFGFVSLPIVWLTFSIDYSGQAAWLKAHRLAALSLIPAISLIIAWTNSAHGLWTKAPITFIPIGATLVADKTTRQPGDWYLIYQAYTYLLIGAGAIVLFQQALRQRHRLHRGQIAMVGLGVLLAAGLALASNAAWLPGIQIDLAIPALAIGAVLISLAIVRYQLLKLSPVARDTLIDRMDDGMLVVDAQERIADLNPAMRRWLEAGYAAVNRTLPVQLIGQPAGEVFSPWVDLIERFRATGNLQDEIAHEVNGAPQYWDIRVSPLTDRYGRSAGRLLLVRDITERKATDIQLQKLSHAVHYSPASIAITNAAGTLEYVNPKFSEVTGYSLREAVGQNPRVLKSGLTPPEIYRELWATITAGQVWQGEFVNRKKNGELYWESATIAPIANDRGEIAYYVATKEDITERRRAERRLLRQKETLSALYQISLAFLHQRNVNDLLQAVVDHATELMDAPHGEIMLLEGEALVVRAVTPGQSFLQGDRVLPDEARLSWQAVTTRQPVVLDDYAAWPHRRAVYDASPLYAVADFPILSGDRCLGVLALGRNKPHEPFDGEQVQSGQLLAQLAALALDNVQLYAQARQELAERKQAEESLRQSEAQYRLLAENMVDVVWTMNPAGQFTYVSPSVEKLRGYTPQEVLAQSPAEALTPASLQKMADALQATMPYILQGARDFELEPTAYELEQPRRDGSTVWTEALVKTLFDDAGNFSGFLGVSRDITTRKRAEDALRQYTVELEASNAELDAFAHTVAHDLNSPLSIVMGFSELLEENFEQLSHDDLRDILPRLSQTSRKMGRIVKELLLLASVRKMDEVDVRVLDMRAIVAETLERFTDLIAATGAEILVPDSWPRAVGHAPWIEEIWSNYISNAIKYGGTPPRVELGADQTGDMVRYWVRDNGAGLTADQQARLFTEFTRLHTQRIQGHGLGLSIVRRIAEKLGGQTGVESEVGRGSLFYFTLPAWINENDQQPLFVGH